MKKTKQVVATVVFVAFACNIAGGAAEKRPGAKTVQPVKVLNAWSGKIADETLRKYAPSDCFLLDQQQWEKLWNAWRGQEKLPEIDFRKEMVLVFTADGPNSVGCQPMLDRQGNLHANAMSTLIGGPGFGYLIQCIPREGVKSVNGKPLSGQQPPAKKPRPKSPRGEPGVVPSGEPGFSPGAPGTAPWPGAAPGGESQLPPIKQLDNLVPKRSVFESADWRKPLVLRSQEEAARHFDADELSKLSKQVDFSKQFVLLFAWRGSGQDRLDAAVAESYPEQVYFRLVPGRTRDLLEHVRIFALRSDVKWSVASGREDGATPPVLSSDMVQSFDAQPPRPPRILTHIPSAAGGQQGIAVGVLPPLRPRYAQGAPVVIIVPGGVTAGGTEGRPEYAGLGFVEIRFAFPGGGRGHSSSGGTYDYRGPNCVRALADVIRFATGRLADREGRKLQELIPQTKVLTRNVGLVGYSHGGNACGMVMATHGEEFPDLAFYASMESPYGEGNVNIELGGHDQGLNPAYDPKTGRLALSNLAWSAELIPGPPRRWQGQGPELKGALFFDLNGDGRFSPTEDFPANVSVQDTGEGPKAWYTPRLIREAEQRKLYGQQRPGHIPSLAESIEYWRWRDSAGTIVSAVKKCPQVAVIVYANQQDHVQVAPDHPHILAQVEGFRQAGAKFVRLNPDRAYVERILASGGPPIHHRQHTFSDNDAGTAWNRENIRSGLEPPDLPMLPYMQAAVCELADRVQAGNWAPNLDAVLYPNAPWTAFFGRRLGGPAEGTPVPEKPQLGAGALRPPSAKPPRHLRD